MNIDHILGAQGLIAKAYDDFEVRPQQIEMAKEVELAFIKAHHLAAEAGTGVGKSFAYLVPAIKKVCSDQCRILISTYTINLQQQLINKDIPFLADILPFEFDAVIAKGRNNYICLRRLKYAMDRQRTLFDDMGAELAVINQWATKTEDGSLSDLAQQPSLDVWDAIQSEHGNCLGRKCQFFSNCFYWRARRRLESANIIIANHALLFSDLILKEQFTGILPDYRYVIIDEAHNIEHVAEDHFGINISNFTLTYLLRKIYNRKTNKGLLAFVNADKAISCVDACDKAAKEFFENIKDWHAESSKEGFATCPKNFVEDTVTEQFRQLRLKLADLANKCEDENQQCEFTRYIERCKGVEVDLQKFLAQQEEGSVYWVEMTGNRRRRCAMRSAPINVGPDVKRCLFDKFESVITTSATLSCHGKEDKAGFQFFASRVGLEDFQTCQLGSPFDYEKNVTLYLEADMPDPNSEDFIPAAAEAIKKYLIKTDGRAFVLFTSYSMLKKMAECLEDFLADSDMELLVQGAGIDRGALLDQFKKDERSVLFGTDSFWQGVDVPGETLSNVIIVKLPFAVPNHPLTKGRIDQLRAQGGNPFFDYQLPSAIIKFKQGFGRLIRNKTDTGIVVVLDSRIARKAYGRQFIKAIPKCRIEIADGTM